jgi:alcohol dehydrogenase
LAEQTEVESPVSAGSLPDPLGSEKSWRAEIGAIRVLFGPGERRNTADLVSELGCNRVLLVSDAGIRQAGHLQHLATILLDAGLEVCIFDGVEENPTSGQVESGVSVASPFEPDCIVALGGGSAMDCAKGINFLLTNGGQVSDYWGFGHATTPMLPSIGIPTTAGTGSEAQAYALISDSTSHRKMACGDTKARFRTVVLDPELTVSAPTRVAATAALDAVSHAVETFVTTRRNPVSQMLGLQAWRLLELHLEASLQPDATLETRGAMLLGAHLAGAAIEQSMLGAAHAGANPLTAEFAIPHGQAVALLLPHVVRFNAVSAENEYRQLADAVGLRSHREGGEAIADRLESMRRNAGLPTRLRQLGIAAAELPNLAAVASQEWTLQFNPRPVEEGDLLALYQAAH